MFRNALLLAGFLILAVQVFGNGIPGLPHPSPTLLLLLMAGTVLASEALRLPLQNLAAVGLIPGGLGVAAAFSLAGLRWPNTPLFLNAATVAIIAGPGSRIVAREILRFRTGPPGWTLPGLTTALAAAAWKIGESFWRPPSLPNPGRFWTEWACVAVGAVVLQWLLTPWWIDKRRILPRPDPLGVLPWLLLGVAGMVGTGRG